MNDADAKPSFLVTLLDFKGRITPRQYWASLGLGLAAVIIAMLFAAMAMNPTGSNPLAFLAVPLFGMFIWILAAAMAKRLRDAGKSPWHTLVFMVALIAWLGLGFELIEVAWPLLPLGLIGLLALVGHIDWAFRPRRKETADD